MPTNICITHSLTRHVRVQLRSRKNPTQTSHFYFTSQPLLFNVRPVQLRRLTLTLFAYENVSLPVSLVIRVFGIQCAVWRSPSDPSIARHYSFLVSNSYNGKSLNRICYATGFFYFRCCRECRKYVNNFSLTFCGSLSRHLYSRLAVDGIYYMTHRWQLTTSQNVAIVVGLSASILDSEWTSCLV